MKSINAIINYIKKKHQAKNADRKEFYALISSLIKHEKIQEMKFYNHHSHTSCFKHSLHVAYYNYKICKFLGWNVQAGVKAGLLHDMFLYDWHQYKTQRGERMHGFEHPVKALKNAGKYFNITRREGDIIAKHMFPLTVTPPRYKETYIIILTDKFCSACEILDKFFKKKNKLKKDE